MVAPTTIRVNLLPHREARRHRRRINFFICSGLSAFVGGFIVLVVWYIFQGHIATQNERNDFIKTENQKLDAKISEVATLKQEIDSLRAREKSVESLQSDRNAPVYLMDELVKLTPEGVFLFNIQQDEKMVAVHGFTASQERVSEFMRNLSNKSKYLSNPDLHEIKLAAQSPANIQRRLSEFSLSFALKGGEDPLPVAPAADPANTAGSANVQTK